MSNTLSMPLARPPLSARIVRFAVVGLLSTAAYSLLYLLLRECRAS